MPDQALLDNDVALKVAAYSLTDETLAVTTVDDAPPGMLGVGRFVIRGRLTQGANVEDLPRARIALERMLAAVEFIEPTEDELAIAAELESDARRRNLELDSGESQLLAVVVRRNHRVLITGDKRAIMAMAVIAPIVAAKRIACLEQLMSLIVEHAGFDPVRALVCSEPRVDRAITICFACSRNPVTKDDVAAALSSYIGHLDRSAPGILVPALADFRPR